MDQTQVLMNLGTLGNDYCGFISIAVKGFKYG